MRSSRRVLLFLISPVGNFSQFALAHFGEASADRASEAESGSNETTWLSSVEAVGIPLFDAEWRVSVLQKREKRESTE
jgi:hypothetical protein